MNNIGILNFEEDNFKRNVKNNEPLISEEKLEVNRDSIIALRNSLVKFNPNEMRIKQIPFQNRKDQDQSNMEIPLVINHGESNKILFNNAEEFFKFSIDKKNYINFDINSLNEFSFPPKLIESIKFFVSPTLDVPNYQKINESYEITRVCKCTKSHCLQQYCECFKIGQMCNLKCLCRKCNNNEHCLQVRSLAIEKKLKKKSKNYYQSAIGISNNHLIGCNCQKSNCSNKYCVCKVVGKFCMLSCKCVKCQNILH